MKKILGWLLLLTVVAGIPGWMYWNWFSEMDIKKTEVGWRLQKAMELSGFGIKTSSVSATPGADSPNSMGVVKAMPAQAGGQGAASHDMAAEDSKLAELDAIWNSIRETDFMKTGTGQRLVNGVARLRSLWPKKPLVLPVVPPTILQPLKSNPAPIPAANMPHPNPSRIGPTSSVPEASAAEPQYHPATDRDPTLSPRELTLLTPVEPAPVRHHAPRAVPIERRLHVQGIVDIPGSESAIVNGLPSVKVGDSVLGAKVMKITSDAVWFRYKNKKFKIGMK